MTEMAMAKECGLPSNFDMPQLFIPCETELARKTELQQIKLLNGLSYPRQWRRQPPKSGETKVNGGLGGKLFWGHPFPSTKRPFSLK